MSVDLHPLLPCRCGRTPSFVNAFSPDEDNNLSKSTLRGGQYSIRCLCGLMYEDPRWDTEFAQIDGWNDLMEGHAPFHHLGPVNP